MCAPSSTAPGAADLEAAGDGVERRRVTAAEVRDDGAHEGAEAAPLGLQRREAEPLERARR